MKAIMEEQMRQISLGKSKHKEVSGDEVFRIA